jgi:hypothetical protein
MANALLLDIVLFLVSNNIVTGDGTDIFRDFTPEKPDTLVALHEYMGDAASFYDTSVHRSVQISCRSKNADAARQKALEIFKALQNAQSGVGKVQLTPNRWGQVFLRQPPFRMKTDENNRVYYAFNIGITTTIE